MINLSVNYEDYFQPFLGEEEISSENLVEQVLQQEKLECPEKETDWETKKLHYLEIEKSIRENRDEIASSSSWQVAGPLNYGMSLLQMKEAITNKFKEMAVLGNLMTESHLNKNYDVQTFFKPKVNLTRIWGAEFLRSNLRGLKTLNAVEHFLIVEDSATEIEVEVSFNTHPSLLSVKKAYVLSKKIDGRECAKESQPLELKKLRFQDFSDPGNIICDSNGMRWVVDTEMKSFEPPKLKEQKYFTMRFQVLTGKSLGSTQTFKIPLSF